QRVREANDAQVVAGFLVRDAQAAGGSNPSTGKPDPNLGVSLGENPDCRNGSPDAVAFLSFTWIDRTLGSAIPRVANYYTIAPNRLVRTTCVGDGGQPSTLGLATNVRQVTAACVAPGCSTSTRVLPKTV